MNSVYRRNRTYVLERKCNIKTTYYLGEKGNTRISYEYVPKKRYTRITYILEGEKHQDNLHLRNKRHTRITNIFERKRNTGITHILDENEISG